jgi:hypothetical protein
MEKALKLLKILRDDYIHGELDKDINEAIAELEAINLTRREWYQKGFNEAMKPKTCDGCKHLYGVICKHDRGLYCVRQFEADYFVKDNK